MYLTTVFFYSWLQVTASEGVIETNKKRTAEDESVNVPTKKLKVILFAARWPSLLFQYYIILKKGIF